MVGHELSNGASGMCLINRKKVNLMYKKYKIALVVLIAVIVVSVSFATGCIIGVGTSKPSQSPDLNLINQAWDAIYQNYVDPTKLDSATLSQGAVRGIVDAVKDPYSAYLDPATYKFFQTDLQGNFEGIGAQVNMNQDNQPIVVAPLENSPAAKAGIKTGDIILAVNGKSTTGMSLTEVVLNIRGPAGTTVTLTILRADEMTPVEIAVVRAQIDVASVKWEMKGDIAYIKIAEFSQTTNDELNKALESIDLNNTTGIILDLRSNPGGLVTAVVDVASHFIKSGVIVTLIDNKGNKTSDSVNPNGIFTELPMVVLVDQYSASGSEILAGALKDYKRATIAGVTTFGKGSYDINIPLKDGSDIYLTVGRWLTPNGNLIEGKGIEPDNILTTTGDDEIQWAIDYLKDLK
jgi:carboxyl-terminal processing protease